MSGKILKHNNYIGSVEVDFEEGVLYGRILFIHDIVTFEADTPGELQRTFELAVDSYVESCAEIGRDPQRPFSGTFNVRVSEDLHRTAAIEAKTNGIKLNELVKQALECYLSHDGVHVHHHDHHHEIKTIQYSIGEGEEALQGGGEIWQPEKISVHHWPY